MVNAEYMKVLAQLESAACTQKEKDAINMVRGRYVQQFGTDNAYVNALGQLEAAAATQKEKDDVNMIRGKYGLFEMTAQLVPYDEELVQNEAAPEYQLQQEDNAATDQGDPEVDPQRKKDIYAMIADVTGYPIDQIKNIVDSFETVERKYGPEAAEGFAKLLPFSQEDVNRQVEKSIS